MKNILQSRRQEAIIIFIGFLFLGIVCVFVGKALSNMEEIKENNEQVIRQSERQKIIQEFVHAVEDCEPINLYTGENKEKHTLATRECFEQMQ